MAHQGAETARDTGQQSGRDQEPPHGSRGRVGTSCVNEAVNEVQGELGEVGRDPGPGGGRAPGDGMGAWTGGGQEDSPWG